MSRAVIAGIAAVVIGALTAVAYFWISSGFESRVVDESKRRAQRAQELLIQNASLEALGLLKQVEAAARDDELLVALKEQRATQREVIANKVFRRFRAALDPEEPRPDVMALVDKEGNLVSLFDARPSPNEWKDASGKLIYPGVQVVLDQRLAVSEIWHYRQLNQLMKVGVAPVIDDVNEVAGALVIAYALSAREAQRQRNLLGLEVAYFHDGAVHATSFIAAPPDKEDTSKREALGKPLLDQGIAREALDGGVAAGVQAVSVAGEDYLVTAGRLPRFSSRPLPEGYPAPQSGAVVLMSIDEAMKPFAGVRVALLLLGVGAIVVALLAILLTAKSILAPLDEIEVGINDIINGNLERTFRPAGSDLDGLANALNVMLARLLGRPEPGEEEYDDEGNVIGGVGQMAIDTEGLSPQDAEAVALAQEPEESYFRRVFDEYVRARQQVGDATDSLTYEAFVAKLRVTEASLKKKHASRAVRFKVVVTGNKVILKPVPIV